MSKNLRRLTILLAAVCVMMIMAVPAFADAGNGYYEIGSPTQYSASATINVKLSIQSRAYSDTDGTLINTVINVPLTGKTTYYVRDVLLKYNTMSTGIQAYNSSGQLLTENDNFVSAFKKGTRNYSYLFFADIGNGEGRIPVDGWMFRVNGQCPLTENSPTNGPQGAFIDETPVANGDVVTFYFTCPFEINSTDFSAKFVSADSTYSNNVLTISLKSCKENHYDLSQNGKWTFTMGACNSYTVTTPTGILYDANFNQKSTIYFSATTGVGMKNISLTPGTYYIYVPSTQDWVTRQAYDWFSGTTLVSCPVLKSTAVFDRIVIQ